MDNEQEVLRFMKLVVEKLTPAITEAVHGKTSGHFEIHFALGEFTRAKRQDSL